MIKIYIILFKSFTINSADFR